MAESISWITLWFDPHIRGEWDGDKIGPVSDVGLTPTYVGNGGDALNTWMIPRSPSHDPIESEGVGNGVNEV